MKRILVVDDEQIVLDVLQRILVRLGYDVVGADSGETALKMYSEELFDLVLMDVLMPDSNGFEIAKEMRQSKPDQKIVMVTGLGSEAATVRIGIENVYVNHVMSKPFTFDKVKRVMTDVLNGEKAFEAGKGSGFCLLE